MLEFDQLYAVFFGFCFFGFFGFEIKLSSVILDLEATRFGVDIVFVCWFVFPGSMFIPSIRGILTESIFGISALCLLPS